MHCARPTRTDYLFSGNGSVDISGSHKHKQNTYFQPFYIFNNRIYMKLYITLCSSMVFETYRFKFGHVAFQ